MEIKQIPLSASTSVAYESDASSLKNLTTIIFDILKRPFGLLVNLKSKISEIILLMIASVRRRSAKNSSSNFSEKIKKGKVELNKKKLMRVVGTLMLVGVVIISWKYFAGSSSGKSKSENRQEVQGIKAINEVNYEFIFPLRNASGEEISEIRYVIEKAELRDEIVIKGQKATAIKGRIFLILTLKISNEYDKAIDMDTRDYVRLSVDENRQEWLAPNIHNDPVEVQAISVQYTRLGFSIDENLTNLVLRVGEIAGEKEEIELKFN